jgi:hypothetical protein
VLIMAWSLAQVFRPVFRRFAKRDIDAYAQAVAATSPGKAGGLPGGSIIARLRALKPRIKRWGYVVPFHEVGQILWWRNKGASRWGGTNLQPPRPANVEAGDEALAAELSVEIQEAAAKAFEAQDRAER